MFMRFDGSLGPVLISTSIFGIMQWLIVNLIRGVGKLNKRRNGLRFNQSGVRVNRKIGSRGFVLRMFLIKILLSKKYIPPSLSTQIAFGAFKTMINPFSNVPIKEVFGRLLSDLDDQRSGGPAITPGSLPGAKFSRSVHDSNSDAFCNRCLAMGYWAFSCSSEIRCRACHHLGHIAKFCLHKRRPNPPKPMKCWVPKSATDQSPIFSAETAEPLFPSGDPSYPATEFPLPSLPLPQQCLSSQSPPSSPVTQPAPPPFCVMANYPCNPMLHVPQGMHVEQGWNRPARSRVALGGEPPRRHEQFAILSLQPAPEVQAQIPELIHDVVEMLQHDFRVRIITAFPSMLGLGLFEFESTMQRAALLDASPIPFAHGHI